MAKERSGTSWALVWAEAKKRKAENAARAAAKAAKEARPMSAKKRRHLEDKKK